MATEQPTAVRNLGTMIEDLRDKVPISKQLAKDVEDALDEMEEYLEASDPSDQASFHLEAFGVVEQIVRDTPDAQLRERLLGLRRAIEAHPEAALDQLSRFT